MSRLIILLIASLLFPVHATVADDAMVLPHGVFHVSVDARFSLPITERFTPSGGTEALATDFNRHLNSTVFRDLQLVEAAFRLPAGSATVSTFAETAATSLRRPASTRTGASTNG